MKSSIITALDIGTSRITCVTAKIYPDERLEICGSAMVPNTVLQNGVITDLSKLADAIGLVVDKLEKQVGYSIRDVFVGVSGISLGSYKIQSSMDLDYGHAVSDEHILKLLQTQNIFNRFKDEKLIHCFPLHYALDEKKNIENPRGMIGCHLSVVCHFVTIPQSIYHDVTSVLQRCHLNVLKFVAVPYASGLSIVSEDDRQLGVAVLDIGAGTVSLSVFFRGILVYVGNIGFGGDVILKDLMRMLRVDAKEAQRLKEAHGSAIVLNDDHIKSIDIVMQNTMGNEERITGAKSHVTSITSGRVEEILEMAKADLQTKGLMNVVQKVILTGGHSQLKHLPKLAQHVFGRPIQLGVSQLSEQGGALVSPQHSAVLGILQSAHHQAILDQATHLAEEPEQNYLNKVKNWIKEHL